MAPQDYQETNPYSRNLILISLAIIIFNFAEGELMDNHLKLHVINIKFNNIEFFSYLVLIMFIWFLFRFWQSNKFKMNDILFDSSKNRIYMSNKQLIKYVELKSKLKYRSSDNSFNGIHLFKDKILPLDNTSNQLHQYSIIIDKKSYKWILVYISLCKDVLIKDIRALESYIPYLIAFIAIFSSI